MILGLEGFIFCLGGLISGLWESFMVPEGWFDEFRLLEINFRALEVHHEPRGVDILVSANQFRASECRSGAFWSYI